MRGSSSPFICRRALLGLALAVFFGAGCAGQIPHATPAQVEVAARRWPDATRDQLEHGRDLYIRRCSGCHTLYKPSALPAERWPAILDQMAPRARLASQETESLLPYLVALSTDPRK